MVRLAKTFFYFTDVDTCKLMDLKSKSCKTPSKEKKVKKKYDWNKIQEVLPSLIYDHNVVLYSPFIGDLFFGNKFLSYQDLNLMYGIKKQIK